MKTLSEVLAEHEPHTAQGGIYCECSDWERYFDDGGSPEAYADHVATAVLAWIDETLAGVRVGGSECGDHEEPDGWRAEFERRTGWSPPTHYPTGYAAGCDGCAAAQSADNEATEVLAAVHAALRGDS